MPVVRVSIAVMRAISRSSSGCAWRPGRCCAGTGWRRRCCSGRASRRCPRSGIALPPPLVSIDASQNASASASHSSGPALCCAGSEPPPARIEPSRYLRVLGRGAGDVALDDLADLLLERHRGQQLVDLALEFGIFRERPLRLWPVGRVDRAGFGRSGGVRDASAAAGRSPPQAASSSVAASRGQARSGQKARDVLMDVGSPRGVCRLRCRRANGASRHDSVVRMCTIPGLWRRCLLHSTSVPPGSEEQMAPQRDDARKPVARGMPGPRLWRYGRAAEDRQANGTGTHRGRGGGGGVSMKTVSRVLNDEPNVSMRPASGCARWSSACSTARTRRRACWPDAAPPGRDAPQTTRRATT